MRPTVAATRGWRSRHAARLLAPLLLAAPPAGAAVFVPSAADPPTGAVTHGDASTGRREGSPPPGGEEPLRGSGIRWRLAPWRISGSLALDLRRLSEDPGLRASSTLLLGDVDFASHIWEPWFVQLRLGFGWIASRSSNATGVGGGSEADGGRALALTARATLSVFPASRFPLELRADVSDSRSGGVSLGGDYRSKRLSLSQSWRPEKGNDQVQLLLDHSSIDTGGLRDRLTSFAVNAARQSGPHLYEAGLTHSAHQRDDTDERTLMSALRLRHGFSPSTALHVDSLATWNRALFGRPGQELGSQTWQLSSFGTWRMPADAPLRGWLGGKAAPLLAASVRWVEVGNIGGGDAPSQSLNATLGLSHEIGDAWRFSLSGLAGWQRLGHAGASNNTAVAGSLSWSPPALPLGEWRYMPNVSASASFSSDSLQSSRRLLGLQGGHGVSRELRLGTHSALSIGLTQSAATLLESGRSGATQALAHAASLGWQRMAEAGSQSHANLSYTQSRSNGAGRGSFEFVNLQLSQRTPLSRYSSLAANVTLQASRNETSDIDPFSGQPRTIAQGWQPFYSANLSYEQQRALDVPRLRLTLIAAASSQQLERRALGDIEAPRERISASTEARLDWSLGRLETRLSARVARVEGRLVSAIQARAQRRF